MTSNGLTVLMVKEMSYRGRGGGEDRGEWRGEEVKGGEMEGEERWERKGEGGGGRGREGGGGRGLEHLLASTDDWIPTFFNITLDIV